MAKKGIDLDITHYDTDELLAMLGLTDPTEDDIINATDRLIQKATAPKVADFFQQVQDALLALVLKLDGRCEDAFVRDALLCLERIAGARYEDLLALLVQKYKY